jgi:2,4-dienoyl-CoA reductase-like NADH-dependent reductase (Old Yellow Enzyme family)
MREECFKANNHDTFIVIHLTHTGRYSSPHGMPAPIIAHHNEHIEKRHKTDGSVLISDDGLKRFEEVMGKASSFAEQAGFDGVDIKCCHGYLMQELLCAYKRPGPYGGSFENRTRLFRNSIQNAIASTKRPFTVTTRMNMYDGYAHPWGFGASDDGTPDLTEPLELIKMLRDNGVTLLNLTSGSPSIFNITCPRDNTPEHPLEGVGRMLSLTGQIKNAFHDMLIVSSAYSYFREFSPQAIAGSISEGLSDMVGYGRLSFAYPNAARDILSNKFDKKQMCYCCNNCGYPCHRVKQVTSNK